MVRSTTLNAGCCTVMKDGKCPASSQECRHHKARDVEANRVGCCAAWRLKATEGVKDTSSVPAES